MTSNHGSRPNQDVRPARQPFFRFFADDWIAGTVLLSYEEKGFFIDLLAAMWSRRGPIPYEQVPMALRCDPRMAKRLLGRLIEHGKVTLDASNRVYNAKLMGHLSTACEGTLPGEDQADLSPDFYPEITPEIGEKSGNIFPENAEKTTKPRARDRDHIHIHTKKEEKHQPASTESVAASEPEIAGLNGATQLIISGLAGWLCPSMPDKVTARRMIERNTALYGGQAIKDAYADLQAKIDAGDVVANPLKAFTGFCQVAARKGPKVDTSLPFNIESSRAGMAEVNRLMAELDAKIGRH